MTEFGEVELDRNLYQAPDTEGLAPLDAAMELPAKQSGAHVPKRQVEQAKLVARGSRVAATVGPGRRSQPVRPPIPIPYRCRPYPLPREP